MSSHNRSGDNPHLYNSFNSRGHRERSSSRPSSAGATRGRSGSFGYINRNPGSSSSNLYAAHAQQQQQQQGMSAGLTGHGYNSSGHGHGHAQRPASAGHSRPTVASTGHQHHSSHNNQAHLHSGGSHHSHHSHHSRHHHRSGGGGSSGNYQGPGGASAGQPISHILNSHNIPSGGGNYSHTGHARPRSAGAVRRSHHDSGHRSGNLYGASNSSNSSNGSAAQQHQLQQQQQQQHVHALHGGQQDGHAQNAVNAAAANLAQQQYNRYAQQQQVRPAPTVDPHVHLNHYTISQNAIAAAANNHNNHAGVGGGGGGGHARPLSANATSHTTNSAQFAKTYQLPTDHWSSNYKMNYGYSAAAAAAAAAAGSSSANSVHSTGASNSAAPPSATAPQNVNYGGGTNTSIGAGAGAGSSRPSSASATATKLRSAVDMGQKMEAAGIGGSNAGAGMNTNAAAAITGAAAAAAAAANAKAAAAAATTTITTTTTAATGAGLDQSGQAGAAAQPPVGDINGVDNDDDEEDDGDVMGLDAQRPQTAGGTQYGIRRAAATTAAAAGGGEGSGAAGGVDGAAEEMDGKPVDQSRSHPEVSMTTPSASLELAHASSHGGAGGGVDARNSSFDSFSEENINVGLSTVPNQFCTKRDALELKKLIALSAGTRGGIVPSSSAVMDMYMVGKVVGVGSYGKVRAAWHRLTSAKVAIKTYDKSKMKDPAHWKRVHSEIKIMEQISHPRIARMYEAVETPKRMHLIMECLDGGNLCSYVKAKRRLSEEESKRIFFQIMQAIEYLHSLGVSHRDVKLENVLFANDREIKLIDFGFSTVCQPGKRLKVFCGTPSYMAPEIVRRSEYEGKPVDMWSMGILLYALLCGCFPFRAKAYPDLYRRIARGTFAMPEELSAPVKDLLKQLLTVDANARINAHSALRHSWLQTQLVNAPNMDKMRQEIAILISDKPADDLDDMVIAELEKFGMSRDEVVRLVLTKTHSSLATLYYLLLNTTVNRRIAAASKKHHHHAGSDQRNNGRYKGSSSSSSSAQYYQQQAAAAGGGGGGGGNFKVRDAPITTGGGKSGMTSQQQSELMAQQAAAEQLALQHHQQQLAAAGDNAAMGYRLNAAGSGSRPRSASQNYRGGGATAQRPLSAYAGRR